MKFLNYFRIYFICMIKILVYAITLAYIRNIALYCTECFFFLFVLCFSFFFCFFFFLVLFWRCWFFYYSLSLNSFNLNEKMSRNVFQSHFSPICVYFLFSFNLTFRMENVIWWRKTNQHKYLHRKILSPNWTQVVSIMESFI